MDVDYQGNKNLLEEAKKEGVSKFIYISVFNAEKMRNLKGIQAKLEFTEALKESGLNYLFSQLFRHLLLSGACWWSPFLNVVGAVVIDSGGKNTDWHAERVTDRLTNDYHSVSKDRSVTRSACQSAVL